MLESSVYMFIYLQCFKKHMFSLSVLFDLESIVKDLNFCIYSVVISLPMVVID